MPKKYLFLLICFLCSKLLLAQNQVDSKHQDSIKNAHLIRQSVLLEESVHPHKSDSIKKATLQQLQNITPKDSAKIYQLIRLLQTIRQADSVRAKHQLLVVDSLKRKTIGYPVMPFDKVLFVIYSPSGGFSPQERTKTLIDKIKKIAKTTFEKDSLKINLKTTTPQILYKGELIFAADTTDALWIKTSKERIVFDYRNRIAAAIISNELATSWITLLEEAVLAVLVILLLTFFIYLVNNRLQFPA